MFGSLGLPEIMIIGVIVALIFGPRQLPKLARGLGESIKEFKGVGKQLREAVDDTEDELRDVQRNVNAAVRR